MRIIWSQQARLDLQQIYGHILPDSPKAARQLHERIRECILPSAETPQIGRPGRVPGTREMVISGTCYIVPYRIVGNTLQILRVYHTARQWPETFE
ncbi:MAG: type II toxin-antitoxin system RelE/ParE family toxin [Nitrosospira sp.]